MTEWMAAAAVVVDCVPAREEGEWGMAMSYYVVAVVETEWSCFCR